MSASVLQRLRGGLVVSIQPRAESPLATPELIAILALTAQRNGAVGVRIQGVANIRAVRSAVSLPIVGLIKRDYAGFEPYITSTRDEVAAVADAGADVVAFDATLRARHGGATVAGLIAASHAAGAAAMADCSDDADGTAAARDGADLVGTTLAGYTPATAGRALPALDLVRSLAAVHTFVVCEGGVATPEDAREARVAGAATIVVGTALTDIDGNIRRYAAAAGLP